MCRSDWINVQDCTKFPAVTFVIMKLQMPGETSFLAFVDFGLLRLNLDSPEEGKKLDRVFGLVAPRSTAAD